MKQVLQNERIREGGKVASGNFSALFLLVGALLTVGALWLTDETQPDSLRLQVPGLAHWAWLETKWLYAGLLFATLFFPLLFSFERRIGFFRKWRFFFPGCLAVAAVFIVWDVHFTHIGVWGFNQKYLSGFPLLGLPWEEWLFFVVVPFSCTFIYEALNVFMPKRPVSTSSADRSERIFTALLAALFFAAALLTWEKIYTATTTALCGFLLLFHLLFVKKGYRGRFYLAYLISWLPFLLVNGVLTGAFTQEPVVVYNPAEQLDFRLATIPIEDSAYSLLLLLANVSLYEHFKSAVAVVR